MYTDLLLIFFILQLLILAEKEITNWNYDFEKVPLSLEKLIKFMKRIY